MFTPVGKRIVGTILEQEQKGKIFIPDNVRKTVKNVYVVASGRILQDRKTNRIHNGDEIIVHEHAGFTINYDGKEYIVLNDEDVIGIV